MTALQQLHRQLTDRLGLCRVCLDGTISQGESYAAHAARRQSMCLRCYNYNPEARRILHAEAQERIARVGQCKRCGRARATGLSATSQAAAAYGLCGRCHNGARRAYANP